MSEFNNNGVSESSKNGVSEVNKNAVGDAILVLNAGSSSLKFSLFNADDALSLLSRGQIDGIGSHPHLRVKSAGGEMLADEDCAAVTDQAEALQHLARWLPAHNTGLVLAAVGHRVVHGGLAYASPVRVDAKVMAQLQTYEPLAPLHQPHNLAAIRAIAEQMPQLPQVACFDTAFHRGHPRVAELFALPWEYYQRGVRRYGFHGLSYEYINRRLQSLAPDIAKARVVVAHLGSGASLCAICGGISLDCTMTFTALDGLPMGTRCGNLDPGVVLFLQQQEGLDGEEIEQILYKRSGLLGISGISNDLRVLLNSDSEQARLAIDYFVYRTVREICAMASVMGGLEGLVFTAGIGENSAIIRQRVCDELAWLGLALDDTANQREQQDRRISDAASQIQAWVIATNEELMIAQHTRGLV